jgi:MoaA/NifB/PqqE/SkfB family radical SAM enzyme
MNGLTARTIAFQVEERNVFFHILTGCNLSCEHCYINKEQHGSNTLPKETIAKWLKLFAHPEKKTNLILLGGEPTLHPDLPFAVKAAKSLRYTTITIDTNGFLHNSILEKISPHDAVLSFSLDGPSPAVNDAIRGEGVFRVCTKNLQKAVQKGFEVSVIYTVSAKNLNYLHKMPPILKKWGVSHFFIQVIGLRGKSAEKQSDNPLQITPGQWLNTVPKVARQAAEIGLHVIYPKVFLDDNEPFECAGNVAENFFIFPNGRVYQCPLCEDHPLNSYSIENETLVPSECLSEKHLFSLNIPEGCVMNKLLQGGNIEYLSSGKPKHRISCCLLKQEILPVT